MTRVPMSERRVSWGAKAHMLTKHGTRTMCGQKTALFDNGMKVDTGSPLCKRWLNTQEVAWNTATPWLLH